MLLAFLEVEIKAKIVYGKMLLNGATHDEQHGVHLEGLNGVRKTMSNGYVVLNSEQRGPRKHVNMSEEKTAKKRERDRQRKRRYRAHRSQEAIASKRMGAEETKHEENPGFTKN
jgi:hypothetical protein